MKWIEMGGVAVDTHSIVAVEKGEWSNGEQDCKAVLVFGAGARVKVELYYKEVMSFLSNGLWGTYRRV